MLRRFSCLIAVVVLSLAGNLAGHLSGQVAGERPEKPASLTLKDMHGTKVRLSDLRGKIVVLNFWATWCGPCNAEMPMLMAAAKSYEGKNVVFVGASVDSNETQGKVTGFVHNLGIEYPIWVGATDEDTKRLQLGNEVPGTAFLDEEGIVRARILGQMRPGEIEERVDWLSHARQGSAPPATVRHLEKQ